MKVYTKLQKAIKKAKQPIPDQLETKGEQIININLKTQIDQQCKLDKLIILNTILGCTVTDIEDVIDSMIKDIIGETTDISEEDIRKVASDLCIGITDEQISQVLQNFDDAVVDDPTSTWDLIVENLIYNL